MSVPIIKSFVKKRGYCSECNLWLPMDFCTTCSACFCGSHIVPHIQQHVQDGSLFKLAQKELGHALPS